jgi:hypothetical protein
VAAGDAMIGGSMLPDKGPWSHPYYAIDDTFVEVAFTDAEGILEVDP